MKVQKTASHRYKLVIFLALVLGSAVSTGLVLVRYVYAGWPAYAFLIWNLLLAWIPLLFAYLAHAAYEEASRMNPFTLFCGFIWLIFLPNAPYLLTDLLHLGVLDQVPLWFDLILLLSFAWTGLFLGLISLYLMQDLVTRVFGRLIGWLFALATLGLTSFGIYLGRFLRWNSWDLFLNPTALLADIMTRLAHPLTYRGTFAVSFLFTVIFTFTYLILFSMTRIPREQVVRG